VRAPLVLAALALLAACATEETRKATQEFAIDTALPRARAEMNCPEATGTVLSRQSIEPMVRTGSSGPERYQYMVAIEGCGKKKTSIVICDGTGCFPA
jgi:hypothetical protein